MTGTIAATFAVAQLVPQEFSKIGGKATSAALAAFLTKSSKSSPLDQLQALAALKANGDRSWRKYQPLINRALAGLNGSSVSVDELGPAIAAISALRVLSPAVPTPMLAPFVADTAETTYYARLALANRDMFKNGASIGTWFPIVQKSLIANSLHPTEPTIVYYVGLEALLGSALVSTSGSDQRAIGKQLRNLRGCPGYADLYRTSLTDRNSCSLESTQAAIDSSFAYE
jgi:hypothetical protein